MTKPTAYFLRNRAALEKIEARQDELHQARERHKHPKLRDEWGKVSEYPKDIPKERITALPVARHPRIKRAFRQLAVEEQLRPGRKAGSFGPLKRLIQRSLRAGLTNKPADLWRHFVQTQPDGFEFTGRPNMDRSSVWIEKEEKAKHKQVSYKRFANIVRELAKVPV